MRSRCRRCSTDSTMVTRSPEEPARRNEPAETERAHRAVSEEQVPKAGARMKPLGMGGVVGYFWRMEWVMTQATAGPETTPAVSEKDDHGDHDDENDDLMIARQLKLAAHAQRRTLSKVPAREKHKNSENLLEGFNMQPFFTYGAIFPTAQGPQNWVSRKLSRNPLQDPSSGHGSSRNWRCPGRRSLPPCETGKLVTFLRRLRVSSGAFPSMKRPKHVFRGPSQTWSA